MAHITYGDYSRKRYIWTKLMFRLVLSPQAASGNSERHPFVLEGPPLSSKTPSRVLVAS